MCSLPGLRLSSFLYWLFLYSPQPREAGTEADKWKDCSKQARPSTQNSSLSAWFLASFHADLRKRETDREKYICKNGFIQMLFYRSFYFSLSVKNRNWNETEENLEYVLASYNICGPHFPTPKCQRFWPTASDTESGYGEVCGLPNFLTGGVLFLAGCPKELFVPELRKHS